MVAERHPHAFALGMVCRLLAGLAIVGQVAGQQLVQAPYFETPSAWQRLNDTTRVLGWRPARIWMGSDNWQRQTVGLTQAVVFPRDGWYQLAFTGGGGGYDGAPMQAICGPLQLSLACYFGSDTRMTTQYVKAGTYTLYVTTSTAMYYPYAAEFVALFIRDVVLPCPNWQMVTEPTLENEYMWITGTLPAGTDLAIYMMSTQRLSQGIVLSGIQGELLLDPWRNGGIFFVSGIRYQKGFGPKHPWWLPLHAQILAIDVDAMKFTLGSRSYSRP